jgi:hypothetical protein
MTKVGIAVVTVISTIEAVRFNPSPTVLSEVPERSTSYEVPVVRYAAEKTHVNSKARSSRRILNLSIRVPQYSRTPTVTPGERIAMYIIPKGQERRP